MDRIIVPGLEIAPSTSPQVAAQPDENMYYVGSKRWNRPNSDQPGHSNFDQPNQLNDQSQVKSQRPIKIIRILIIIIVLLLAVALAIGLSVGLSAQHKQKSSNDDPIASAEANNTPVTIVETSNAPISTQNVGNIATTTPTTTTQSGQVTMITPTPDAPPFRGCPETNGSTYTATKEISQEDYTQIHHTSLKFEILCDTEYVEQGPVMDIQLIANVSTLNECLDLCAIYDFQMRMENFPAHACTGASWAHDNDVALSPRYICWLRNNVTLGTSNWTSVYPGYDSGVLLLDA